jgi:hypothetical protein
LSTTYQSPHRRFQYRLINWIGTRLKFERLSLFELTEKSLLETAQRLSGLSDFGDDRFLIPLRKLLESLNQEAHLNPIGQYFFRQDCIRLLVNRLKLQNDFKHHPEILQVPIQRPLFVVGLFRSGTTFLHNLLSQDPASRWLHLAEALYPSPPPEQKTWANDSRLEEAKKIVKLQNSLALNFATAHHIAANKPAECSRLFEHEFIGHLFDFRANVKSYSEWLYQQDLRDAYQSYKQQLQYLAWNWSGEHWTLKAPAHLFALDALLETFPDACIVHIHRDPYKVLPSICSVSAIGRGRFSDNIDLKAIGNSWLNQLVNGVESAIKVRERSDNNRFYDVNYVDFIKEPLKTIYQIYDYFGYQVTPKMENNVNQWINKNPQHKHGVHRYSLEQFGLNITEINQKFAHYRQKFHLLNSE